MLHPQYALRINHKMQKKLMFNECMYVYLIQTRLNFTTDFLSQNNPKAKYRGEND